MSSYFQRFVDGYVETAIWAERIPDGTDVSRLRYDADEDCTNFVVYAFEDLAALSQRTDLAASDPEQSGGDFYLSRNRHGAGFFDRGLGALGSRLQEAAKTFGEVTIELRRGLHGDPLLKNEQGEWVLDPGTGPADYSAFWW